MDFDQAVAQIGRQRMRKAIFNLAAAIVGIAVVMAAILSTAHAAVPQAALAYRSTIVREAESRFGLPAPTPVIAAQIMQESQFNPRAQSQVGASGLMQFMPKTAEWAAVAGQLGQAQPTSPAWAIRAGVWYDRWLYDRVRVSESECDRWNFALSAYNGGLGNVYKRQKMAYRPGSWALTAPINPGITPANQRENEDYSKRILTRWQTIFTDWGRTVCLN
jgi:soluble lytic murein transglycosylase-like protein